MTLQPGNMSQVARVAKDFLPLASNIVGETAATMRNRRENPTPKPTTSSDANISNFGLFNYLDSRNMSDDGKEKRDSSGVSSTASGMLLGLGIGAGIAGAVWLIDKVSRSKQPPATAMPARGQGRVVKEEVEEEEQGEGLEEEEEEEEEE